MLCGGVRIRKKRSDAIEAGIGLGLASRADAGLAHFGGGVGVGVGVGADGGCKILERGVRRGKKM